MIHVCPKIVVCENRRQRPHLSQQVMNVFFIEPRLHRALAHIQVDKGSGFRPLIELHAP